VQHLGGCRQSDAAVHEIPPPLLIPARTHGGKTLGGASFHLLLQINHGGDAFLHTDWASGAERCRKCMPKMSKTRHRRLGCKYQSSWKNGNALCAAASSFGMRAQWGVVMKTVREVPYQLLLEHNGVWAQQIFAAVHESLFGPSRHFAATHNSVAFGAERTFSEPRWQNRIYEYAP
jgi:hypothetical protein